MSGCQYDKLINKTLSEICQISKDCDYDYFNLYDLHYCKFEGKLYFDQSQNAEIARKIYSKIGQ